MSASRRTIVVIHPGGLGDVLLSLGALAAIRAGFPQREIVLLVGLDVGQLLVHCGVADHVWAIESGLLGALFTGKEGLSPDQLAVFRRCDLVVGWLHDQAGALSRTMQELDVPRVILQSPASTEGSHQSERFLHTLQGELRVESRPPVGLYLPDPVRQSGAAALGVSGIGQALPLIMCHPGSGSIHKCVRADMWGSIIRGCRARQLMPVVILGPADDRAGDVIQAQGIHDLPILRPQSVTMLAAVLAQAQGYIGHDSGVTHLAALLGLPTVAMFGPTDERRWAPHGQHVEVVKGSVCACADWNAVRACIEKPCLNVNPEEVFEALARSRFRYHRVTNS